MSYSVGSRGDGMSGYANNDNGGTVFASTEGRTYGGASIFSELRHYITVDHVTGALDELVPLRIRALSFYGRTGAAGGSGLGYYNARQAGRQLTGARGSSGFASSGTIFDLNQIVYVTPDVPILIEMQAISTVSYYPGQGNEVTVDPVYTIVGDYASRYKLSGLLSSGAIPAPVPEPAPWAMMIAGFGMIGAVIRHRRRQFVVRSA
ncbi:PEPxxWA-CTERM sorting domain-containing protein [Sandaracinobacteroides hominis]|uniref:PEPxxWA-CTERM sorting domain-containing protein n=1 Tax=Sandaracinobacteroides hominis TaxID=2780086 RepID=UPI002E2D3230|nr:PEPxxWA-CTERM sorting domain-containing protein [Sandaracinobacteroides hominis]